MFFQKSIVYLEHRFDKNGLHTLQDRILVVKNAAIPKNVTPLKSFLSLVNYYYKFIKNAYSILNPLFVLLKKDALWSWSRECQSAFESVKNALISNSVPIETF